MNTKDNTAGDAIATPQPEKSFAAAVDFAQLLDEAGRPVLLYGPWVRHMLAAGQSSITLNISLVPAQPARPWLTVREAASVLKGDLEWISLAAAEERVRRGCSSGKLSSTGSGTKRRIDPISLDAWRLSQRDAESDKADRRDH